MNNMEEQEMKPRNFVFELYKKYTKQIEDASSEYILTKENEVLKRNNEKVTPQQWIMDIKNFLIENPRAALSNDQCDIFTTLINDDKEDDDYEEEEDTNQTLIKYKKVRDLIFQDRSKRLRKPDQELKAVEEFDHYCVKWFRGFYKVEHLKVNNELTKCKTLESLFDVLNNSPNEINFITIRDEVMDVYNRLFLCSNETKSTTDFVDWGLQLNKDVEKIGKQLGYQNNEIDDFRSSLLTMFCGFNRLLLTPYYTIKDFRIIINDVFSSNFDKKVMMDPINTIFAMSNNIDKTKSCDEYKVVSVPSGYENTYKTKLIYKNNNTTDQINNDVENNNNKLKRQKNNSEEAENTLSEE